MGPGTRGRVLSRVCRAKPGRAEGAPLTGFGRPRTIGRRFEEEKPPAGFRRFRAYLAAVYGTLALTGIARCRRLRNGEQPPTCGKRGHSPASAAVPVSAPAREGTAQPTPRAWTAPAHSPVSWPRWSRTRRVSRIRSAVLRVFCLRGLCASSARSLACRRRALEAVEKVVTVLAWELVAQIQRAFSTHLVRELRRGCRR